MEGVPAAETMEKASALSTEELRQEVARLRELLLDEEDEGSTYEGEYYEEEGPRDGESGGPVILEMETDRVLKYTNGDTYKVNPKSTTKSPPSRTVCVRL